MTLFWILLGLLGLTAVLICYSACVVAGRADEWEEIVAAAEQRGWNKGYDDCLKDLTYGTIRTRERSEDE